MIRLRENEVSTNSETDYSKLIGDFVNETKREVEDSWNWTQLRTPLVVTTSSSDNSYTLTGSNDRTKILQVIDDTNDSILRSISYSDMNRFNTIGAYTDNQPIYYSINGSTSGEMDILLHPTPDGAYTINFYSKVPQADLSVDGTELTVPSWPVILGAYAKAISERGEDGGQSFGEAASMYNMAMSDAIALDSQNTPQELVWGVR